MMNFRALTAGFLNWACRDGSVRIIIPESPAGIKTPKGWIPAETKLSCVFLVVFTLFFSKVQIKNPELSRSFFKCLTKELPDSSTRITSLRWSWFLMTLICATVTTNKSSTGRMKRMARPAGSLISIRNSFFTTGRKPLNGDKLLFLRQNEK